MSRSWSFPQLYTGTRMLNCFWPGHYRTRWTQTSSTFAGSRIAARLSARRLTSPEILKKASGLFIMTKSAIDNVGSIKSIGKAKAVRESSPEAAPARPAQRKVFVLDPKASSFTPQDVSGTATARLTNEKCRTLLALTKTGI